MSEVFKSLLESLGYRFFLSSLAPALVLATGLLTVIVLYPDPTLATWPAWWGGHVEALLGSVPFWGLVTLLALASIAFNRAVVQFWEGYPWRKLREVLRRVSPPSSPSPHETWEEEARSAGGELRKALIDAQDAGGEDLETLRRGVARQWLDAKLQAPPLDRPLPTRLGRILRRMEIEPFLRYGIDSIALWSRFLLAVPAAVADQYRLGKTWL